MIIKEIEEFKIMKSKLIAYLSYIFSQNLVNLKADISEEMLINSCKNISNELVCRHCLYVLDKNGYQITDEISSRSLNINLSKRGENQSHKSYYKKSVQRKKAYLSQPYPNSYDSKLCVSMAMPIYSDKKELKFVICCDILLEDVLKLINPSSVDSIFGKVSRISYFLISLTLFIVAGILFYFGVKSIIFTNFNLNDTSKIFESTILLTLSLAILDLIKAYFEEEILGKNEKNSTNSKTMIKFLSSIIIALAIEALMLVFKFAMTSPEKIVYPVLLIAVVAFLVICLGGYIYITRKALFEDRSY
ncbi:hypothetical protein F1B92_00040 [Campylobacter sp. FMV-PI01]|uniref:General glycosylation pathway protein n=1 Tax=Campylobacter portucalensis TaxID=2608384 RepID=A0A6L5WIQ8_9BACT|nr:PDC sensor domain-containing protein [Campylobacter portucalensis]MSN95601.1 hypothetical protein [Campylobacter portucalensis]